MLLDQASDSSESATTAARVAAGGSSTTEILDELWSFDLHAHTWSRETPAGGDKTKPSLREAAGMAALGSTLFVFGGQTPSGALPQDISSFNTGLGSWTRVEATGPVPPGRTLHTISAVVPSSSSSNSNKEGSTVSSAGGALWVFGGRVDPDCSGSTYGPGCMSKDGLKRKLNDMYSFTPATLRWKIIPVRFGGCRLPAAGCLGVCLESP